MAVLDGRMPDTLPVVPQSFMFAVETAGYKIGEVNRNGRKMAEAHIVSQEKYGYDGCVIDFDDATIAEAVGAKVIFRDDEPAIVSASPSWTSSSPCSRTCATSMTCRFPIR